MRLAKQAGSIKTQNMVVLGAAAAALPLPAALLEDKLHELFAPKGERIVKANVHAFRKGQAAQGFAAALTQRGISSAVVANARARPAGSVLPCPNGVSQRRQRAVMPCASGGTDWNSPHIGHSRA